MSNGNASVQQVTTHNWQHIAVIVVLLLVSLITAPIMRHTVAADQLLQTVIVQTTGDPTTITWQVQQLGGEVTRSLPIIDGFVAVVPAPAIEKLQNLSGVRSVTVDALMEVADSEDKDDVIHAVGNFYGSAYGRSHGTRPWSDAWQEIADDGNSEKGAVRLDNGRLKFDGKSVGIQRTADLHDATSAELTFTYQRDDFKKRSHFAILDISADAGMTWQPLFEIAIGKDDDPVPVSLDLGDYVGRRIMLRIQTSADLDRKLYIDDFRIALTTPDGVLTIRDDFAPNPYSNNEGSLNFADDWQEINDDGDWNSGKVKIDNGRLKIDEGGRGIERAFSLSQIATAQLEFRYQRDDMKASNSVTLAISPDNGESWITLREIVGGEKDDAPVTMHHSLDDFVGETVLLRVLSSADFNGKFFFDNLHITTSGATGNETFADSFENNLYQTRFGRGKWVGAWQEINDDDNDSSGKVRIEGDWLKIESAEHGITRRLDLRRASEATLDLSFVVDGFDSADAYVALQLSDDGGATWSEVDRLTGAADQANWTTHSYDLSAFVGRKVDVRLISSAAFSNKLFVDTVEVRYVEENSDGSFDINTITTEAVRDQFHAISFDGNDGEAAWMTRWQELGEADGPSSGSVQVLPDATEHHIIESRISKSSDDAEEKGVSSNSFEAGDTYLHSSDLELVSDWDMDGSGTQLIGLRFNSLDIPQGAQITNAYIAFNALNADAGNNAEATTLQITAQADDNPTTFLNEDHNISDRPRTQNTVTWSPDAWQSGQTYTTPDLSTLVQEVVNRDGWTSSNSMVFMIDGSGSRSAESWDNDRQTPPQLIIEYDNTNGGRCVDGNCLVLGGDKGKFDDIGVARQVNLLGATRAKLNFSYQRNGNSGDARIHLEVSADSGNRWTRLATYHLADADSTPVTQTFDLLPYVAYGTQIRFIGEGKDVTNPIFAIDNIEIDYTTGVEATISPQDYLRLIDAQRVTAENVQGNSITVAVVDTGIDPAMLDQTLLAEYDAVDGTGGDPHGHGTFMAGVIASRKTVGQENLAVSVAPAADLVSVRVLDAEGKGSYAQVIDGLDWILTNKDTYNIRVVNLSLVGPVEGAYWENPINQAVEALWDAGIVVVVAAGNTGPYAGSITTPGNDPFVITVGAITDNFTPNDQSDDFIPPFSAAGPSESGFIKPDIIAPGAHIIAHLNSGAAWAQQHTGSYLGSGYYMSSGTSVATAVTAGAVALMLDAQPDLTPNKVKFRLMASAVPAVDQDDKLAFSIFQ